MPIGPRGEMLPYNNPGMGAGPGPDLPPGIPQGPPMGGGGMPAGLFGAG